MRNLNKINTIIAKCLEMGMTQKEQIAYVLATVKHETNDTFDPVREAYWLSETWRKKYLRYYPYYGRGYVQLTWLDNYKKYGEILGIDLVNEPDLAMDPDTAAFILIHGFMNGTFTGSKIDDYIDKNSVNYKRARRCINGMDKASLIAHYAREFEPHVETVLRLLGPKEACPCCGQEIVRAHLRG